MINETLQRLTAPMPRFFKKVLLRLIPASATLVVTCSTALGTYGEHMNPFTHTMLQVLLGFGLASGIVGGFITSLSVDWDKINPDEIPNVKPPQAVTNAANESTTTN